MKNLFKGIAISLAFVLSIGAGVVSLAHSSRSETKQTEAVDYVNNVWYVFANDSTCSSTRYYQKSGSDNDTLNWNAMTTTDTGGFTIPGSTQGGYTVSESSANKNYNYCYRPFFFYPYEQGEIGITSMTRYTMSVTFTLSLTKTATGGGAYAFAELFFLGNSNATSNQPIPTLNNNGFDTKQSGRQYHQYSLYNNSTDSSDSIGCYTDVKNTAQTASQTFNIVFDNASNGYGVSRYQLGLFVGCNYGSSYEHTTSATVTAQINSVTKTNLVATNGNKNFESFSEAYNSLSGGGTLTLLRDCNIGTTNAFTLNKNMVLNLGGHTLSAYDNTSFLQIGQSRTVTITNGTLRKAFTNVSSDETLIGVQSSASLILNGVTAVKTDGPSATIIMSSGSLVTANSETTIRNNSTYTTAYAIKAMGTLNLNGTTVISASADAITLNSSCTANINGGSISSTSGYAINAVADNSVKTINISGNLVLSSHSSLGNIGLGANCGRVVAEGLTRNVTVDVHTGYFTSGSTIVQNDNNNRVSMHSLASSGYSYVRENNNIIYKINQYTLTFYPNGGTGNSHSVTKDFNTNYTLPNNVGISISAPAYHSFLNWNTSPNGGGTSYTAGNKVTVTSDLNLYAIWYQTDTNVIEQFIGIQLHFDVDVIDVDDQSNTGHCLGEGGYYDLAKQVYNTFTNTQKTTFCTSGSYANARARLKAWANANGEDLDLSTHELIVITPANTMFNTGKQTTNTVVVVTVCSLLTVISLAAFIIARRKRIN